MANGRDVRVLADPDELARAAREELVRRGRVAIAERGRFMLALSGGSTPKRLYASLDPDDLKWSAVELFFGDERCVAPDHPDSNYRMVRETLLDRIPIPPRNVHRIQAELPSAKEATRLYERELARAFRLWPGHVPRFDLMLLGLGADGHTASLFPGTDALKDRKHLVAAVRVKKLHAQRITLTIPVFEQAACLLFLVSGADKAPALKQILASPPGESDLPAGRIRPLRGELIWLVDQAAIT